MAFTVTGVPEKIARADYLRLVESLGLDWNDLRSLEFHPTSITATVLARNTEGLAYMEGDTVAEHNISIPVED